MNKQLKVKNGVVVGRGIEWCDYSWNAISGCLHECKWEMPDGTVAICYAKSVAERVAVEHFPHGFAHHYVHPHRLQEPHKVKEPAKIFLDSMSDLMGAWVAEEEILQVLDVCRQAHWHTFQLLTKNAPRLLKFDFPRNVWTLVSSPPDWMWGKRLSALQQEKMLRRDIEVLAQLPYDQITGMSIEPLSWNIAPILDEYLTTHPHAMNWAIVGAASNGNQLYQPDQQHLDDLLAVLDKFSIPVFYKGNLSKKMVPVWREEFPASPIVNRAPTQLEMF